MNTHFAPASITCGPATERGTGCGQLGTFMGARPTRISSVWKRAHFPLALTVTLALVTAGLPATAATFLGFSSGPFYSIVGTVDAPTSPNVLQVLLDGPALADTFIGISSSNPSILLVSLGGVLVSAGQSVAAVPITSLSLGTATLSGTLGSTTYSTTVEVVATLPAVPAPPSGWLMTAGLGLLGLYRRLMQA